MDCDTIQAAVSARADGEPADVAGAVIEWHLRSCADCAGFAAAVDELTAPRSSRERFDVSPQVVAMARRVDRGGVWWGMRAALFLVSAGELALAIPDLVARASAVNGDIHMQRHLGAFQIAFAVGLMVVALRPAKARALVPLTAALALAMVGASIADIAQGVAPALGEAQHSLELAGLALVWLLAARRGWPGRTRTAREQVAETRGRAPLASSPPVASDAGPRVLGRHSA